MITACSTAPKKPAEIFDARNHAASQLTEANALITQGRCDDALLLLDDIRLQATRVDDPSILAETAIAAGNALFTLGRLDEALAQWAAAAAEADADDQKDIAARARLAAARARLLAGQTPPAAVLDEARAAAASRLDPLVRAAAHLLAGMAEKDLSRYAAAETSVRAALAIHERQRRLEDAAYDWYFIASIRSVAGNYDAAVEALWNAIRLDRRAENGPGLALSWEAMAEVCLKAGRPQEAAAAQARAAAIKAALAP